MTLLRMLSHVSSTLRRRLIAAVLLRIIVNGLDLLGVLGVGLIAISLGGITGPSKTLTPLRLPVIGELALTQQTAAIVALVVGLIFVSKSVLSIFLSHKLGGLIADVESQVTAQTLEAAYRKKSATEIEELNVPDIQNAVVMSTNALTVSLLTASITIASESTLLVLLISSFLAVNPIACLALLVYLGAVVLLLNRYVSKKISTSSLAGFEAATKTLTGLRDLAAIKSEADIYGISESWKHRIAESKRDYSLAAIRVAFLSSLPRYFIESALIVGVFSLLGVIVIFSDLQSQALTLGVFLTGGLRLVASILPLQSAVSSYGQASALGLASLKMLEAAPREDLAAVEVEDERIKHVQGPLVLRVRSLSVVHPSGKEILSDISFDIHENMKVAIVGPSGSGKTTLLHVLVGIERPSKGNVNFFRGLSAKDGAREIGFVPQKPLIISGTLADNITLRDQVNFSNAEVEDALRAAGLHKFLESHSEGLKLQLDPDLPLMSGGEIQRLGIARALIRKPKFLFFDEATSALDARTEWEVSNNLDTLGYNTTRIFVAHRLSTVVNADLILYIKKGKLIASGKFEDLYKELEEFRSSVDLLNAAGNSQEN